MLITSLPLVLDSVKFVQAAGIRVCFFALGGLVIYDMISELNLSLPLGMLVALLCLEVKLVFAIAQIVG